MRTRSMPASSMRRASTSTISSLAGARVSPVNGSTTSSSGTRPRMRSRSGWMISPPSTSGVTQMPLMVPQSSSVTIMSWATSTKRRVRYPESAVLSAVSANPLRAPWVEMKYCRTVSPSRKLAVIGVSMISPDGLAIRPRMPASCRICWRLPRAPESAIMNTGLNSPSSFRSISLNISSETCSVTWVQMSMILLYRSPFVIRPSWYSFSTLTTSRLASSMISPLLAGMSRSSTPMEIPASVAYRNPSSLSASRSFTVSVLPIR